MTLIEAAKLALEHGEFPQNSGIIHELRQAIADAEHQEPYAYAFMGVKHDGTLHGPHLVWKPEYMDAMSASKGAVAVPIYMHPPKREWQGLSKEEKQEWVDAMPCDPQPRHCMILVNAVEAALEERNT